MAAAHLDLFRPAIEAVRSVLRDLDEDQIPADLRRVATATGGVLPPPLAKAAMKGLERYDWLRERSAEKLGEAENGPSGLLVRRPDGWTVDLAEQVALHGEGRGASTATADRRRLDDLERRLEATRSAAKARAAELEAELRRLRAELDQERSRRKAALAADARLDAAAAHRISELEASATESRVEVDRVRAEVDRLTAVERKLRRERSTLEAALTEATTGPGWLGADPSALAAHLDELGRMARSVRTGEDDPIEPGHGPLRLPKGLRPDRHEAIDWLAERSAPTTLVVDGYNAGFHLTGGREPAAARRRLGLAIDRLSRIASGPLRMVIVYDSSVETAPPMPGAAGPEVRFTEPGTPADEEIARLAAALPGAVVVVSSDRWVREVAETAGALALWSEALVDWSGKR